MDLLTIIIIAGLAALTLALILYPLWRPPTTPPLSEDTEAVLQTLEEYQTRYEALLATAQTLQFDYEMGKVTDEDYQTVLQKTKLEAAQVRQRIDQIIKEAGLEETRVATAAATDAEIEVLIARTRSKKLVASSVEPPPLTCPTCGHSHQSDDAFCPKCGTALSVETHHNAKV